jgi:hypothetical protein
VREELASKVILSALPTFSVGTVYDLVEESKDVDYVLMDTATPPASSTSRRPKRLLCRRVRFALTEYLHKRERIHFGDSRK